MTKKLDENSPANSVSARLAVFALLAGAAAGTVGLAIRRYLRRAGAEASERPDDAIEAGFRLSDDTYASTKPQVMATEPGREGTA
jgi:hypothetical protein